MALVSAGITPHSPLLVENIGKEKSKELEKTKKALSNLEKKIYITKPDVIVMISPFVGLFENKFTINGAPNLLAEFSDFGDLEAKKEYSGAPILGSNIADMNLENTRTISDKNLDQGSSVILKKITEHINNIKILPIGYSKLDRQEHVNFGRKLNQVFQNTNKRISFIICGDTSHRLSANSPLGFHDDGSVFTGRIRKYLKDKQLENIVDMDQIMIDKAGQFLYKSLLIMSGVLSNINYDYQELNYENPFGIGLLTSNIDIS